MYNDDISDTIGATALDAQIKATPAYKKFVHLASGQPIETFKDDGQTGKVEAIDNRLSAEDRKVAARLADSLDAANTGEHKRVAAKVRDIAASRLRLHRDQNGGEGFNLETERARNYLMSAMQQAAGVRARVEVHQTFSASVETPDPSRQQYLENMAAMQAARMGPGPV